MAQASTTTLLDHLSALEEPIIESKILNTAPVSEPVNSDYNPLTAINPNYILQKGDALKQQLSSKANLVSQNIATRASVIKSMAIEKRSVIKRSLTFIASITIFVLIIILFYAINTPDFGGHGAANTTFTVVGYAFFSLIMGALFILAVDAISPAGIAFANKIKSLFKKKTD